MHLTASLDTTASTPWVVKLDTEPGHVVRLVPKPKLVKRLVPGSQDFPGGRVEVVAGVPLVPDRQLVNRRI